MTQTITLNGVDRSGVIRRKTCTWSESAYLGEVGTGSFTIDDDSGNISAVGWKTISVDQTAGTQPDRIATGFVGAKSIQRSADEDMGTGATGRKLVVSTKDLNDLLTRIVIWDTDGKRPSETITARIAWLMASDYLSTLVFDHGRIAASALVMDKNDYRGSTPFEVLSACARRAGFNFYVRWHDASGQPELVFRNDNTSTDDTSTISISNVKSEINSTSVFAPNQDHTLTIDPEHVYSDVYAAYSKGVKTGSLASTASTYVERWGVNDDSGIKNAATAASANSRFLKESATEENLISVTLRMRAAYVNLVRAGDRIAGKFTHMAQEGYGTSTYFRVLRRRVTQPLNTDNDYDVQLDLSPQEGISVSCPYEATAAGTFYPLGDQPPTGPSEWYAANVSDGVTYYLRPGIFYPTVPTPGAESQWHFIAHVGAGGAGSIDYAGDCVQNTLQFIVVGPGTLTVQTEIYGGSARPMAGSWGESPDAYANSIGMFTSGDEVEFTVTGECANVIRLYDGPGSPCGGKWGWSSAEWVPA